MTRFISSYLLLYSVLKMTQHLCFCNNITKYILIFMFERTSICFILSYPLSKILYIHMSVPKISNLVKTALFSFHYQPQTDLNIGNFLLHT